MMMNRPDAIDALKEIAKLPHMKALTIIETIFTEMGFVPEKKSSYFGRELLIFNYESMNVTMIFDVNGRLISVKQNIE